MAKSEGKEFSKTNNVEHQKRIYAVSRLLRRKPVSYIIEFIKGEWNIEQGQAYNYIKEAREEWKKYFAKLKSDGMGYYVSQMRELKDRAFNENDSRLAFDISKEEAKLMGTYPANKIDISDVKVQFELVESEKTDDPKKEEK